MNLVYLSSFTSHPIAILLFRVLGFCSIIAGIITAAFDISLGGFKPFMWFLLAFASFLGAICNTLFAIRELLESRFRDK
jgi:hypothetical protein